MLISVFLVFSFSFIAVSLCWKPKEWRISILRALTPFLLSYALVCDMLLLLSWTLCRHSGSFYLFLSLERMCHVFVCMRFLIDQCPYATSLANTARLILILSIVWYEIRRVDFFKCWCCIMSVFCSFGCGLSVSLSLARSVVAIDIWAHPRSAQHKERVPFMETRVLTWCGLGFKVAFRYGGFGWLNWHELSS